MAIKIYIDQGHNPRSYNTGAEGNGYFEQDITFRIGNLLNDLLKTIPILKRGFRVQPRIRSSVYQTRHRLLLGLTMRIRGALTPLYPCIRMPR